MPGCAAVAGEVYSNNSSCWSRRVEDFVMSCGPRWLLLVYYRVEVFLHISWQSHVNLTVMHQL